MAYWRLLNSWWDWDWQTKHPLKIDPSWESKEVDRDETWNIKQWMIWIYYLMSK